MIMKTAMMVNKFSRSMHKVGFKLKKHSPEILMAVGITGSVVSTVLACKATLKVDAVVNKTKKSVDKIHTAVENGKTDAGELYNVEDSKKDLTIVYAQTGLELAKLYAPAVIVGVASVACILASNNILNKRNAAIAAAYATVDKSFKEYRERVVDRFGKDLDRELKYNIKAKDVEEIVKNEDGTETVVKKTINVGEPSEYSRFFDETCSGWTKDAEYNLMFIRQQQNYANELLQRRGYVYLNEVYEMLGMQKSKPGHVIGWMYDELNPVGDNYIDFGIYDVYDEAKRRFVNGHERSILLDFNVDGNIWEMMK